MATIIDATGRELSFPSPPKRVVSLIPSITEALFDLGLRDVVVGISQFCNHPADEVKQKPRVGGQKNPDYAKIQALNPDLIILNQEENRPEDITRLALQNVCDISA